MAFEKWQHEAAEMKQQQMLLEGALRKFKNAKLFAAWNQWRSWAAEMRRQTRLMAGAVRRMIHRKLSAAFEQWQSVTAQMKQETRLMGGAVRRMIHRKLSAAFEKWQQSTVEAMHEKDLLGKAVARMRMRKVAAAFDTWHAEYELAFEMHNLQLRALFCWTHREFSAAFIKWYDVTAEARVARNLADWAMRRWQHQTLSSALQQWRAACANGQDCNQALLKAAQFWEMSVRNAISRLYLACWNTWRAHGAAGGVSRALGYKAALRWQHRHLAACFASWREAAQERSLLQQMYQWVVVHWERREARWALNIWLHSVRHGRKHTTDSRALGHWLNQKKSAAFNKWADFVLQGSMAMALARKSLLAWTHQSLHQGISTWLDYMDDLKRQQELLYKAASMWSRIFAVRAINQWRSTLLDAQGRQEMMYETMFKWAHRVVFDAFNRWRDAAYAYQNEDEAYAIAEQHYHYSNLSSTLMFLRYAATQGDDFDSDKAKADRHAREQSMRGAFIAWDEFMRNRPKPKAPDPAPAPVPAPAPTPSRRDLARGGPASKKALAVDPYGLFSVLINKTAAGKQDRALYYVVQVTLEGRNTFDLNKRYRDFDVLNSVLQERFASIFNSTTKLVPVLPPKKAFTKLNPEHYDQRAHDLHQYIQDLVAHAEIAASEELCEFLQFHTHVSL